MPPFLQGGVRRPVFPEIKTKPIVSILLIENYKYYGAIPQQKSI